jgi:hypothetical protein
LIHAYWDHSLVGAALLTPGAGLLARSRWEYCPLLGFGVWKVPILSSDESHLFIRGTDQLA